MAYVITQACIGVKDTACVAACPTDSIHGYKESPQLYIEPATCIDCDACAPACPVSAIYPGDQVPEAMKKFTAVNVDFFKNFDRSRSVALSVGKKEEDQKEGVEGAAAVTANPAEDATWVEQPGWEAEWQKHVNDGVERTEEQKRYGRVKAVYEAKDRYILRFYLPEKTPNHPFRFKFGLPAEMSTYNVTAELKNGIAYIKGRVANPKIAKLSGHANSFPDRFSAEYIFPTPVSSISVNPKGAHVVDIVVTKTS